MANYVLPKVSRFDGLSLVASIDAFAARAIDFENRPSSALVGVALSRWHHNLVGYRTRLSQAAQYDRDVLVSRALMFWRIKLRVKLKLAKNAKVARKYLLIRSAWKKWRDMAEEKKRENLLKLFGQRMIQKHFESMSQHRYIRLLTYRFSQDGVQCVLASVITGLLRSRCSILSQVYVAFLCVSELGAQVLPISADPVRVVEKMDVSRN